MWHELVHVHVSVHVLESSPALVWCLLQVVLVIRPAVVAVVPVLVRGWTLSPVQWVYMYVCTVSGRKKTHRDYTTVDVTTYYYNQC